MNIRYLMFSLIIVALILQGKLWLSEEGFSATNELNNSVVIQKKENHRLRNRNNTFEAEVIDLKKGRKAAEERARNDLGLIGINETFYHVVPKLGKTILADNKFFE